MSFVDDMITIEGIGIANLELRQLLGMVREFIVDGSKHVVMYANIHTMNLAHKDGGLKSALINADLVYCDGSGVALGAWILGKRIKGRLTAADFIYEVCDMFQQEGRSLFLLAGEPGVAETASEILRKKFPRLSILGTSHGYFIKEGAESDAVIDKINAGRPDCLFVGIGSPVQELWVAKNSTKLNTPVIWCVGATFDFITGKERRAPLLMQQLHLEWLFRLSQKPTDLFHRYIVGNPTFVLRMMHQRLFGDKEG